MKVIVFPLYAGTTLGIGVAVPAMTVQPMTAAGPAHVGIGSAAFNATRQIGTLIASLPGWYDAARHTFLACALACALGATAAIAPRRSQLPRGVE